MTTGVARCDETMPAVTSGSAVRELTGEEMDIVWGGVNADKVTEGLTTLGLGILAIVALPEAAFVGAAYYATALAAAAIGTAAGIEVGEGLRSN
ncbi:MAG: hypothetical protein D6740_04405 [Alphaproteobacteria bacterium]|nr:MAG: hypothetical protein D6740_04405 [Alphaproteobacteria bacterium]